MSATIDTADELAADLSLRVLRLPPGDLEALRDWLSVRADARAPIPQDEPDDERRARLRSALVRAPSDRLDAVEAALARPAVRVYVRAPTFRGWGRTPAEADEAIRRNVRQWCLDEYAAGSLDVRSDVSGRDDSTPDGARARSTAERDAEAEAMIADWLAEPLCVVEAPDVDTLARLLPCLSLLAGATPDEADVADARRLWGLPPVRHVCVCLAPDAGLGATPDEARASARRATVAHHAEVVEGGERADLARWLAHVDEAPVVEADVADVRGLLEALTASEWGRDEIDDMARAFER